MKEQRAWWMPRRLTFWDMVASSALAAFICAIAVLMIYRGPEYGLPQNDRLVVTSGRIVYAGSARMGRGSAYTIFRLDASPTVFEFTGAMGDFVKVREALCQDCEASVWTDPADRQEEPFAWQIRVNGKDVARYPDVKAHWISDRRWADLFAPIAGLASVWLATGAFRRRREDRARRAAHVH